jgi:hypothetical protein
VPSPEDALISAFGGIRSFAAPENGLGEWLTTAIHDAKPLNACPIRAVATGRPSLGPGLGPGLDPAGVGSRCLPGGWRSSI